MSVYEDLGVEDPAEGDSDLLIMSKMLMASNKIYENSMKQMQEEMKAMKESLNLALEDNRNTKIFVDKLTETMQIMSTNLISSYDEINKLEQKLKINNDNIDVLFYNNNCITNKLNNIESSLDNKINYIKSDISSLEYKLR